MYISVSIHEIRSVVSVLIAATCSNKISVSLRLPYYRETFSYIVLTQTSTCAMIKVLQVRHIRSNWDRLATCCSHGNIYYMQHVHCT